MFGWFGNNKKNKKKTVNKYKVSVTFTSGNVMSFPFETDNIEAAISYNYTPEDGAILLIKSEASDYEEIKESLEKIMGDQEWFLDRPHDQLAIPIKYILALTVLDLDKTKEKAKICMMISGFLFVGIILIWLSR